MLHWHSLSEPVYTVVHTNRSFCINAANVYIWQIPSSAFYRKCTTSRAANFMNIKSRECFQLGNVIFMLMWWVMGAFVLLILTCVVMSWFYTHTGRFSHVPLTVLATLSAEVSSGQRSDQNWCKKGTWERLVHSRGSLMGSEGLSLL